MGMTPADVEQKTFSTALRGYDLDEVDDFLDDVITTIRDLQDQIADAKASKPVTDSTPAQDESAIGRVLMTAQATADTMIADAQEEASQILADARAEADSWAAERDAKKAAAEEEMAELASHVGSVRTQLAVLATVVADRLDEMDESIGGQDQTDQDSDVSYDIEEATDDGSGADFVDDEEEVEDEEDDEPDDDSTSELSTMEDEERD